MTISRARRDFGLSAIRLGRRWRNAVDAELSKFGLTSATWRPLFYLGEMGSGVRPKDLAEALDVERPSVVQLVDRLERQGLVERADDPHDRRGKVLHLTEEGWKIHRQTIRCSEMVAARLMEGVSDGELDACLRIFRRVVDNARAGLGEGEEA